MDNRIFKKIMVTAMTAVMLFAFTGCGKGGDVSGLDRSSIVIEKDGKIVSTIIEDFAENYYDTAELQEMTENEINAFIVSKGEGAAEFDSLEKDGSKVKMVIKFGNAEDYSEFNSESLSYVTISDAIITGKIDVNNLLDVNGAPADAEKAASLVNEHVVITGCKNIVAFPYKIKYVSPGVKIVDKYMVDLSETADGSTSYIVLNK